MKRLIVWIIVVAAGMAVGYYWPSPAYDPSATSASVIAPASRAASSPAAATAPATPPTPRLARPQDTALRDRAIRGDDRAAQELHDLDETCRLFERLGNRAEIGQLVNEELLPPPLVRPSRFAQVGAAEVGRLRDPGIEPAQRERLVEDLSARLAQLCAGYAPLGDADRFAVAVAAAANDPHGAFWQHLREPPFLQDVLMNHGGDAAQVARSRDWAERMPRELRRRGDSGDADAALALAFAYSGGYDEIERGDFASYPLLNSALDDDPAQALHWYARYLQLQPDGPAAALARAEIARLSPQPGASTPVQPVR